MSYIVPNSTIIICKNVPLDKTYEHTIYFSNRNTQANYFQSLGAYTFTEQSYQRVRIGVIKLQINAEQIYNANYLMFRNTNFGNKWFYCFIDEVEYINNNVSQINYTIDVMQTWLVGESLDYTLKPCLIERETVQNDGIFENLLSENIDVGVEYTDGSRTFADDNPTHVMALCALDQFSSGAFVYAKSFGKIYSACIPCEKVYFADNNVCRLTTEDNPEGVYINTGNIDNDITHTTNPLMIENLKQAFGELTADRTMAVYQYPYWMTDDFLVTSGYYNENTKFYLRELSLVCNADNLNGYVPRNKKLFNYPFNYCEIINTVSGDKNDILFEYVDTIKQVVANKYVVNFAECGVKIPCPSTALLVKDYANSTEEVLFFKNGDRRTIKVSTDRGVSNKQFPNPCIETSAFREWWYHNGDSFLLNTTIKMALLNVGPMISGGSALASGAGELLGQNAQLLGSSAGTILEATHTPNKHIGNLNSEINLAIGLSGYEIKQKIAKEEFLKIADNYFDHFGYSVNKFAVPKVNNRPYWTYVKTNNCCAVGSVPADDMKKICNIYDKGITFWRYRSDMIVGDYSKNNTPES